MGLKDIIFNLFWICAVLLVIAVLAYVGMGFFAQNSTLLVASYLQGPVGGATISVYSLADNGSKGDLIANGSTGDDGIAEISLSNPPKRILVESRGGSYLMNANRVRLSNNFAMVSIANSNRSFIIVTPFSNMAASLAQNWAKKGHNAVNASMAANLLISHQYNLWSVIGLVPADATNKSDVAGSTYYQRQYSILLEGFSLLAEKMGVSPQDLAQALAKDWGDGKVDGLDDGNYIFLTTASGASVMLSDATALKEMQDAINEFLASPDNEANLIEFDIFTNQTEPSPDFYIDESSLPAWIDGEYAEYQLTAIGGTQPYAWKLKEGSALPNGFTLGDDGVLYGTGALSPGTLESISPPFTITVADSSGKTTEMEFRINIVEKPPRLTVSDVLCYVGEKCEERMASAGGGALPYYFVGYSSENGDYPLDLMLWQDGTIRGTPKRSGNYAMEVCVIDSIGWESCADASIITMERPVPDDDGDDGDNGGSCTPGHYATVCGGRERCCLNGWVCCNGQCAPPSMC